MIQGCKQERSVAIGPQLPNMTVSRNASGISGMRGKRPRREAKLMMARYYSTSIMRFASVDPVQLKGSSRAMPQMWNRYTYSLNNPIVLNQGSGFSNISVG